MILEGGAALVTIIGGLYGGWRYLKSKYRKGQSQEVQQNKNETLDLVKRFLLIYKSHGIERTQLPRFLAPDNNLSLADVSTDKKLLLALTEDVLNRTCDSFGVRREWLDGKDGPIYPYFWFDKNLGEFIDFLADLKSHHEEIQMLAIKCPEDKLEKQGEDREVAILLRAKIAHLGHFSEDSIWKY
ncbi:hypothetical protein ACHHRT_11670, partial [Desulfurivibrio sp. D14AmB]|uniref:hypothetical protein n=1 Tax=Desulfurivibrio sp. D14AmB TaxID=3374370 RepID=UPI00376ECDC3